MQPLEGSNDADKLRALLSDGDWTSHPDTLTQDFNEQVNTQARAELIAGDALWVSLMRGLGEEYTPLALLDELTGQHIMLGYGDNLDALNYSYDDFDDDMDDYDDEEDFDE